MFLLFLVVAGVIALVVVKVIKPNQKHMQEAAINLGINSTQIQEQIAAGLQTASNQVASGLNQGVSAISKGVSDIGGGGGGGARRRLFQHMLYGGEGWQQRQQQRQQQRAGGWGGGGGGGVTPMVML